MWGAFNIEIKHLFSSRWKIFAIILLIITPLIYGLVLMGGFWQPLQNVNNLKIYIVNKDTSDGDDFNSVSKTLARNISGVSHDLGFGEKNPNTGETKYTVNIQSIYDPKNQIDYKKEVENGNWDASFVIPDGFSEKVIKSAEKSFLDLFSNGGAAKMITAAKDKELFNYLVANLKMDFQKIDFYNSYKNNYIVGELTNMGAQLSILKLQMLAAINFNFAIQEAINKSALSPDLKDKLLPLLENVFGNHNADPETIKEIFGGMMGQFITHKSIGSEITSYGKGLSPYLLSLSIWAGTLFMAFYYKNHRIGKQVRCGTLQNYFGKTVVWLITGWIQTLLLIGSVMLLGLEENNDFSDHAKLVLYALFISTIFSLVVQGIAYSFRFGELGGFIVLILLITQLAAGSGTFPSELQNKIFSSIHPYIPFTYSIEGFRELLHDPNLMTIFKGQLYLLIYLVIVPISLIINLIYDKKNYSKINGRYPSFEIELHDE